LNSIEIAAIKLRDFIYRNNRLAVATHVNADIDAVACAVTIRELLRKIRGLDPTLVFPDGLSKNARRILEDLNLEVDYIKTVPEDMDGIIIVDTNSPIRAGVPPGINAEIFIIDHHEESTGRNGKIFGKFIEPVEAAAVLVYELIKYFKISIDDKYIYLLLIGILSDSGRFTRASPRLLKIVCEMLEKYKIDYAKAIRLLKTDTEDMSEKIAKIKGVKRAAIYRVNNWIIGVTKVSAFEAAIARTLLDLGVDIVFVGGGSKNNYRLIIRASETFVQRTNIHMRSFLIKKIQLDVGGFGRGHKTAAGLSHLNDVDKALEKAFRVLLRELGIHKVKMINA